jgi:hypothetical protein
MVWSDVIPIEPAQPIGVTMHTAEDKPPPKLFECKLCGKTFDSEAPSPSCPECDSNDVEQVG